MLNHNEELEFFKLKDALPNRERHLTNMARVQSKHEFGILREIWEKEVQRASAALGDKYDESFERHAELDFKRKY